MFAKKIRFHNFNLLLSFPLTSQFAHFCNLGNKNSNSAGKFINKVGSNKKPKMCVVADDVTCNVKKNNYRKHVYFYKHNHISSFYTNMQFNFMLVCNLTAYFIFHQYTKQCVCETHVIL